MKPSRDLPIDILKTLALFCILVAHAEAPEPVFGIRNFDVVLLVLVSGILLGRKKTSRSENPFGYWRHRLGRILIPTWVYLGMVFAVQSAKALVKGRELPGFSYLWHCLLLDVDYVWIIRVFVLVALAAPWIFAARRKLHPVLFWFLLLVVYGLYEWVLSLNLHAPLPVLEYGLTKWVDYLIPYGAVFTLGLFLPKAESGRVLVLSIFFLTLFLGLGAILWHTTGGYVPVQTVKYPPRIYYLSYGLGVSLLLYGILGSLRFSLPDWVARTVSYVGENILWLYFWHTFLLTLGLLSLPSPLQESHYLLKVLVLFLLAFLFLQAQKWGERRLLAPLFGWFKKT